MAAPDIKSFRDLDTWKVGMELALTTYELAVRLPASERFELSQQIRRAATSIPANVAEGHATGKDGLFLRHVCIALGSLAELDTELELARRLGFLTANELAAVVLSVSLWPGVLAAARGSSLALPCRDPGPSFLPYARDHRLCIVLGLR